MNDSFTDHKEPEEHFLPLNSKQYAELYSIEMGNFMQDIRFYQAHCKRNSRVLELGCGTGRISQALSSSIRFVTGMDISLYMLQQAAKQVSNPPSSLYVCMDMTKMAFSVQFDHIIIPYNTLNLLNKLSDISRCLQQVATYLKPKGSLLLQLHIPNEQLRTLNGAKLFQFQIFPLPGQVTGKLIKETLRGYHSSQQEIRLEERYRIRPEKKRGIKQDLKHILHLAAFSPQQWLDLLNKNGFNTLSLFGDYDSHPFMAEQDSMLLIKAKFS